MDETVKLIIAFISGPIFLGAIAAAWYYWTKVREPARIKEAAISSASNREMDRSSQMFREGQAGKVQDQQSARETKYMDFLLASNDGKISQILSTNESGTAKIEALILRVSSEQAERDRLVIASFNQLITLFSRFLISQPERADVADFSLALKIQEASIESTAVQQVKGITTAAASEPGESPDSPGTATIAVTGKQVE